MQSAIKPLIRTLVFYLLSVLAIAAVLVAGGLVLRSVDDLRASSEDLRALAALQQELGAYREQQAARLTGTLAGAPRLPLEAVDARIGVLTQRAQVEAAPPGIDLRALLRTGPEQYAGRIAAHYKQEIGRELAAQELAYLRQLRAQLLALRNRDQARQELERLHGVHTAVYRRYLDKEREIAALGYVDRQLLRRDWTVTPGLRRLAAERAALRVDNERAAAAYRAQKAALERIAGPAQLRAFTLDEAALARTLAPLDTLAAEAGAAVSGHPLSRVSALLWPALPAAVAILAAALAGRFLLRAVLYFGLAPLAARAAPLRLDGAEPGADATRPLGPSAVSQALVLEENQELLVLPAYLQSTPVSAHKSTRWLATGRWRTGLAAGMVLLTAVRTEGRADQVVVSAGEGGLGELALLRVAPGSAFVFLPRALVGMVCERGVPPQVERRWRLASPHAWLTLQWRYFVVRGPVTLVLQGRRGVRVRAADGAHLVRPAATLGFSAGVARSAQRSAPFLPYLRGQAPLLYDRFAGAGGIVAHDEAPGAPGRGGRVKRGLEGLADGVLKVFGF